jgi:hypothetical protein
VFDALQLQVIAFFLKIFIIHPLKLAMVMGFVIVRWWIDSCGVWYDISRRHNKVVAGLDVIHRRT